MILEKIKNLGKSFYPTGRAFKIPFGSTIEKLNSALSESENNAYKDALSILDSAIPDNVNFTTEDATQWERRLGLITNISVSLDDRKLAIQRKMRHPGNIPARQNYLYLEGQLQAAGFNVFVFENRFSLYPSGYETLTASEVAQMVSNVNLSVYGNFQYGELQYGQIGNYGLTILANNIDEKLDENFNVGTNLRSTFFVGGTPVGSFASVDIDRQDEFRQLILKIKPLQAVGYLFINYN